MQRVLLALALCGLSCGFTLQAFRTPASAQPRPGEAVVLRFTDTDVSDVLLAIGRSFRANVVAPSQLKKSVTVNISVRSVEEALSAVTAVAGLAWRRVDTTYVVAQPADLKQALEARGNKARLKLSQVPAAEAAAMLSTALPYLSVRQAGEELLLVGADEDIAQARELLAAQEAARALEAKDSRVVKLEHAAAAQIITVVKDVYPSVKVSAVGSAEQAGAMLSITGPRPHVAGAVELIAQLDVATGPREPAHRIYQIRFSSAPVLLEFLGKAAPNVTVFMGPETYSPPMPGFRPLSGASLGTGGTSGGGGGMGGGMSGSGGASSFSQGTGSSQQEEPRKAGDRARVLVLNGPEPDVEAALALLAEVDIAPRQVMIEVKVVDTSPERAEALGVQWNWTRFGAYEAAPGTEVDTTDMSPGGELTNFFTRPMPFGLFSRVPWTFEAVLNAMVRTQEAKILATPRMQVVENDEANIFIGDTIRTQVSQASIAGTTIQVFEFPVGIILLVRPRVNADGRITMRVHPVVSTVTGFGDNDLPQTRSREAETTVMVKDGETVVIGGLIREEDTRILREVPFLSRLPILGELFKHRSRDHRKSEVLVFITPRLIQP